MKTSHRFIRSGRLLDLDFGVAIGLAAALLFFAISGVLTYFNFQGIREANQKIVQTHQAIVSCKAFSQSCRMQKRAREDIFNW